MALKAFTDPIVSVLRSLGVMFANPPPNAVNFAGVNFNDAGVPQNLQDPAGNIQDFPGGGGGGGIPIPANNSGADVVINSAQNGSITVACPDEVAGAGGPVTIQSGSSPDANGGDLTLTAGSAATYGGSLTLTSGQGENGDCGPATILIQGGGGNAKQGGGFFMSGGNGASTGVGGGVGLQAGNASGAGGRGGDLELLVGGSLGGGAVNGKLKLGAAAGATLATANGTGTVTTDNLAPGVTPLVIKKWLPVNIDGTDYLMPIYGA